MSDRYSELLYSLGIFFFYGSSINIGIWEKENKSRTHLPTLLQTFQMIGDRNKEESAKDRKKNI